MRSIIFSLVLLTINTISFAKSPNKENKMRCGILMSNEQSKSTDSQLTEYEVFAQKYEATFGEKPSDQVWNLGKKSCAAHCSVCQGGQCAGT